jgi:DNA-binding NtrC family response regulator
LRDRPDDIGRQFVEQLAGHWQDRTAGWAIAPQALAMLRRYPWPGNERELNNVAAAVAEYSRPHRDVRPQEIVRALGGRDGTHGPRRALSFAELLEQMREFEVDPSETEGAWPLLHEAFGALWRSMLVAAAKAVGNGNRIRSAVGTRIHAIDRTKDPKALTAPMNTYMSGWTKEFGLGEGEQRAVIEKLNDPKLVEELRDEIEG